MDSNKFKESDINYFIQVKVTNQQLVAPNLSSLCPIDGVRPADFTRVFGDSFISGLPGRRRRTEGVTGPQDCVGRWRGAGRHEEGRRRTRASRARRRYQSRGLGGGDVKNGEVKEWTLDPLKAVALEIPEHVMAARCARSTWAAPWTSIHNAPVSVDAAQTTRTRACTRLRCSTRKCTTKSCGATCSKVHFSSNDARRALTPPLQLRGRSSRASPRSGASPTSPTRTTRPAGHSQQDDPAAQPGRGDRAGFLGRVGHGSPRGRGYRPTLPAERVRVVQGRYLWPRQGASSVMGVWALDIRPAVQPQ